MKFPFGRALLVSLGMRFDPALVNVTVELAGAGSELSYDSSCAGTLGWRFDREVDPTAIVLCPGTCDAVRGDATAKLKIGFGCARRDVIK